MLHHSNARARRTNDGFTIGCLEYLDKTFCELTSFLAIAGIEGGLPAASLPVVKADLAPGTAEHFYRAHADVREQLIYETGDEEGNFHAYSLILFQFNTLCSKPGRGGRRVSS